MADRVSLGGKREWLARALFWSGAKVLLSQLPARDSLLVLNYHRIGDSGDDLFDPGLFSATADEFNNQISYLKQHLSLVTLEEALSFVDGTLQNKNPRCRALITLDDGYLDNYQFAYPILRSQNVQGTFFLITSMVGSSQLPWWDHIAYCVKTARRRRFSLRYPVDRAIDLDANGLPESIEAILKLYKMPENTDPPRFIRELEEQTEGEKEPQTLRRFLNWDEAREMLRGGMALGSHTHSHQVLSQLEPDQQYEELSISRAILKNQLGIEADVLSYPVGGRTSFTAQTQMLARQAGYRAAISHYGGKNLPGNTCAYDLKRVKVVRPGRERFQVQTTISRFSGEFWP